MANQLASGMAWLDEQLRGHASSSIIYTRGSDSCSIPATIGRQIPKDAGEIPENGVYAFEARFTFRATALVLNGMATLPQRGDKIEHTANGVTFTFDVLPIDGERWSKEQDAFGLRLEVLGKLAGRS